MIKSFMFYGFGVQGYIDICWDLPCSQDSSHIQSASGLIIRCRDPKLNRLICHWHPGWGVDPIYVYIVSKLHILCSHFTIFTYKYINMRVFLLVRIAKQDRLHRTRIQHVYHCRHRLLGSVKSPGPESPGRISGFSGMFLKKGPHHMHLWVYINICIYIIIVAFLAGSCLGV